MFNSARVAILKVSLGGMLALFGAGFLIAGCAGAVKSLDQVAPAATSPVDDGAPSPAASLSVTVVSLTVIPPTVPPPATGTPTPTPAPVCAPFPGYSRADLLAAISNPYNPPPPGSDDPHQGVDLAVIQAGMALAGGPAHALLAGQVALVVRERFPYGNAVLVETRLDDLPAALPEAAIPTLAPTLPPHPALTCPALELTSDPPASGRRSLYLLYAHLQELAEFEAGDTVACGQRLGLVGQSGNALNPHLHIEARLGPAGVRLPGLAHYESRASAEEMGAYCLWRVSNRFQLVNPTQLLEALP